MLKVNAENFEVNGRRGIPKDLEFGKILKDIDRAAPTHARSEFTRGEVPQLHFCMCESMLGGAFAIFNGISINSDQKNKKSDRFDLWRRGARIQKIRDVNVCV